jgi:uncharacterized protein YlxW (UPF0749 family)
VRAGPRALRRLAVPAVLLASGLLVAVTAAARPAPDVLGARQGQLAALVGADQQRVAALSGEVAAVRGAIDAATARAARSDRLVAAAEQRGSRLFGPDGLDPVTGRAVTVILDDAAQGAPVAPGASPPTPDDLVVHQQDIEAVVNALWAGGAQAMTLQGQRVVTTTPVQCVGNTLLLGGQVYSPPYQVSAVGPQQRMLAALRSAPDLVIYREYVRAYGLGYQVRTAAASRLAGYTGPLELAYAVPIGGAPAG